MAKLTSPSDVVEGFGLDSLEYKASTKDVGIKIYGDFGTQEGQAAVVEKLNFAISVRARLAAAVGVPLPNLVTRLPSDDEVQSMFTQ